MTWQTAGENSGTGTERGLAPSRFIDLCARVGPPPDAMGIQCGFEQAVRKARGGSGFADVWYPGRFALAYKGRGKRSTPRRENMLPARSRWSGLAASWKPPTTMLSRKS